jgi:hypothetical protein
VNMGIAWYMAHPANELDRQPRAGSSDRDYFRALGIDVDAPPKRHRLQRRTTKLRAAIPASFSVFRELMRRPAGATVVVLVPRSQLPSVDDEATVFVEHELRAS